MNTTMSNAQVAPMIKSVAKTVSVIVKRKQKLVELMTGIEEKYKALLDKQVAKYKEEYDALTQQQELFEAPVRKLTGGYSTEDLIITEFTEGVDKNGKPSRKPTFTLKYPDTIVPPAVTEEAAATDSQVVDTPRPETETHKPFEGVDTSELSNQNTADDLPFDVKA